MALHSNIGLNSVFLQQYLLSLLYEYNMKRKRQTQKVHYFKRWTRKRYAIFSSMRKVIVISVISFTCSFLLRAYTGLAQQNRDSTLKIIQLKEINIFAEEDLPSDVLQSNLLQNAISKKEIESVPARSFNELLKQLPGLDVRQRGGNGVQADISIRGGNFDQTLLLLNGINVTDPQTGHYTLNLPLHNDIIHNIEIYKNTGALLYGASSFTGIINVITQPDTVNNVNFHLMGGMYETFGLSTYMSLHTKNTGHLIAADYKQSAGYRENTDFKIYNAYYQLIGKFKKGQLEFQTGLNDKAYGANSFYSLRFPNQFEHTQTLISSVRWKNKGLVKWVPALYYRLNYDCFELVRNQEKSKNNYHTNQVVGFNFINMFATKIGKTGFSFDYRIEDIVSTSLGNLMKQEKPSRTEGISYRYGKTRQIAALSAGQSLLTKNIAFKVSILGQYYVIEKNFYLLPASDFLWCLKTLKNKEDRINITLFASAGRGVRTPTFTDLYYRTGDIVGNPNLKPEQTVNVEIGTTLNVKQLDKSNYLTCKANVFFRWGRGMIDYIKKENDSMWQSVNHTDVFFIGNEFTLNFYPSVIMRNDFLQSIALYYTYLYSDKESEGYISRYVLDHLTHKLSLQLSHRIYKEWAVSYAFSYNVRKGEYVSYTQNTAGGIRKKYPPFSLLDIRMHYRYRNFYVYVEANNVLNVRYFDIGGLEQAGIWVTAGVKYKFVFDKKQ